MAVVPGISFCAPTATPSRRQTEGLDRQRILNVTCGAIVLGMPQSLANYDAALKNIYAPGLRNSINYSNPVLTEVVRDTTNVSGRSCFWPFHSGRSASTGARAEFGVLPVADRQRYIAPEDNLRYQYHTIKVSRQARHLTHHNARAFAE